MEGLAAAGGVIAVVGLAGQVLQGCSYLRTVFDDAKDSPDDLRLLQAELAIIAQIVESMRLDAPLPSENDEHHPAEPALQFCEETLNKLQQLVGKYGDLVEASKRRKWGKRLAMAMNRDKIKKYVGRLERAKGHLLAVDTIEAQKTASVRTQEILSSVSTLCLSSSQSATTITKTEGTIQELKQSSQESVAAVKDLAERVTSGLEALPSNVSVMVERTVKSLLVEHLAQVQSSLSINESHNTEINKQPQETIFPEVQSPEMRAPDGLEEVNRTNSNAGTSNNLAARRKKSHCIGSLRVYNTWLGRVRMITTDTLYFDRPATDAGSRTGLDMTRRLRTDILIIPKRWLRSRGTLIRYEQQNRLWVESPNLTIRIQHFNTVPGTSPIFNAKTVGEARQLFESGAASVFDRDETGLTLLDVGFWKLLLLLANYQHLIDRSDTEASIPQLLELTAFYVELGLDPAAVGVESPSPGRRSPIKRLLELDDGASMEWPRRNAYISQLTRLIVEHAQTDPLELMDFNDIHHGGYWRDSEFPATRVVLSQESWCIDWKELAHQSAASTNFQPSMGTKIVNLISPPPDGDGLSNMKPIGGQYSKTCDDRTWLHFALLQCQILGLLLAAGMPTREVREYGDAFDGMTANDGALLHIMISRACKAAPGEVFDGKKFSCFKSMGKLRHLLTTSLKHGVDPQSHNSVGLSVTSFAKSKGVFSLWKEALSEAGFDANKVVMESKDIEGKWKPGSEVLMDKLDPIPDGALAPTYAGQWHPNCWFGTP